MASWTAFPYAGEYVFDAVSVKKYWARLHAGDAEPLPTDAQVLQAWALFHSGEFRKAMDLGLKIGGAGLSVANKSACVYATYLEKQEKARLDLYQEVAQRAAAQLAKDPQDVSALYWHAYALGRYSQGISVAKALAQGLGSKVKGSLENVIRLQPKHADAHIALGAFHAEVIDKVGSLIGGMTYGAKKDTGLALLQQALKLNLESAIGMIEYANAILMLEGDRMMKEATRLYQLAATAKPLDAMERLDIEMAKGELED
jgi:tetratricopeptide (TPR) repeat protein